MPDTLPDRIESAACGSRELDREIWYFLHDYGQEPTSDPVHAPHYTTSIDAAMTLVDLETCAVNLSISRQHFAVVTRHMNDPSVPPPDYEGEGANTPLALCAAALRARKDG